MNKAKMDSLSYAWQLMSGKSTHEINNCLATLRKHRWILNKLGDLPENIRLRAQKLHMEQSHGILDLSFYATGEAPEILATPVWVSNESQHPS